MPVTFNAPANVTDLSYMFFNASEFNQNIGLWDTSNSKFTNISYMFYGAKLFNQNIAEDMLDILERIKEKVLPKDQDLFNSVVDKLKVIAYPPIPIVPIPPPLNPADISPLLNEIMIL